MTDTVNSSDAHYRLEALRLALTLNPPNAQVLIRQAHGIHKFITTGTKPESDTSD